MTVPLSSVSNRISFASSKTSAQSSSNGSCGASLRSWSRRHCSNRSTTSPMGTALLSQLGCPNGCSACSACFASVDCGGDWGCATLPESTKSPPECNANARRASGPKSLRDRIKPRARTGKCGTRSAHWSSSKRAPEITASATGGSSDANSRTKGGDNIRPCRVVTAAARSVTCTLSRI